MKTKYLLALSLLFLCVGSTYAASGGLVRSSPITLAAGKASLWGNIDEPVPPIQQIEQQQQQLQAEQQEIANEKTICELLTAQPSLSADQSSATQIVAAIQRAYKAALPDYQMFLASPDAANNLYAKYRDLYLKTYCTATK